MTLQPLRQHHKQQRGDDCRDRSERAVDCLPAEMRRDQCHQRQAAGYGNRPAEKHKGDRARPLAIVDDQRHGGGSLRGVNRADRQHADSQQQDDVIVRRQRRRRLPCRKDGKRCDQKHASVHARRQPGHDRRTDAEHDGAVGDQQTGVVDADVQASRKVGKHPRRPKDAEASDDIAEHQHDAGEVISHGISLGRVM